MSSVRVGYHEAHVMAGDAFGGSAPFSLGVEEECFLVDPVTGVQANSSAEVLARVAAPRGTIAPELHACQIELITEICASADEAAAMLAQLRRSVRATGAGLIGTGTHPAAPEGHAEITDRERYERIRELLGAAVATPVAGLHVHVGMPDGETAIRAFNALRADLPLLAALAANSPYRHRRDTGLASAREVTIRGWPRSGVPPAMHDYDDFLGRTERLTRAAGVPDYTWFWWKLRPHPRLGTVEIRALDAQCSTEDTRALVALAHCLARSAAEAPPVAPVAPEILDEGIFRAARYGVQAELPDRDGTLRPVPELVAQALDTARPHAGELRCVDALEHVPRLLEHGGGAGIQRRAAAIAGTDALLRDLLRRGAL
jgi:carboxylate-amine ligase